MSSIVTSSYRPKRAPRKRKPRTYPENMPAIVTPAPMKKRREQTTERANDNGQEPQPKTRTAKIFGDVPDYDLEEHRRAGDKAEELFREIVRRAALYRSK